jgi:hypothetical protein
MKKPYSTPLVTSSDVVRVTALGLKLGTLDLGTLYRTVDW